MALRFLASSATAALAAVAERSWLRLVRPDWRPRGFRMEYGHGSYVPAENHAPSIAAFIYRDVLVCRSCVLPEESDMTGQFFDQHGVRDSGWKCDRCGVEIEHQPHPPTEVL